jgi:hypothetical protein
MTPEQSQRYGGLVQAITAQAASFTESGLPADAAAKGDREGSDGAQAAHSLHHRPRHRTA